MEKALFMRLHLLQGIVSFHQGHREKATQLLTRVCVWPVFKKLCTIFCIYLMQTSAKVFRTLSNHSGFLLQAHSELESLQISDDDMTQGGSVLFACGRHPRFRLAFSSNVKRSSNLTPDTRMGWWDVSTEVSS